ncbi:hypothetical protein JHV666_33790 [Mycobacterium avium subsp. hominissuis]
MADLDGSAARDAGSEIYGLGMDGASSACDVTSEDQMRNLVTTTVRDYGRLDIFVNNAGITRDASLKKNDGGRLRCSHYRASAWHVAGSP